MNVSPLAEEIGRLNLELNQALPTFINQLNRREVQLVYERITGLREYLQHIRSTQHSRGWDYTTHQHYQQRHHQQRHRQQVHACPSVLSITHNGFPMEGMPPQGDITVTLSNGTQSVVRGTPRDYETLLRRSGLQATMPPPMRIRCTCTW